MSGPLRPDQIPEFLAYLGGGVLLTIAVGGLLYVWPKIFKCVLCGKKNCYSDHGLMGG